jgi:hypothetical protein
MSASRFDDLARALAAPMPRRRALRLCAGIVLAGAFPWLGASPATAGEQDCAGRNELCPTPGSTNCGHRFAGQTGACCCYCCATPAECGGGNGTTGYFCRTPCVDDAFHQCMNDSTENYDREQESGCGGDPEGCQDAIFIWAGALIDAKVKQHTCRQQAQGKCGPCETCDFESGLCASRCPPSESCCAGVCTDLANDPNNCGSCGRVCVAPSTCNNGHCV